MIMMRSRGTLHKECSTNTEDKRSNVNKDRMVKDSRDRSAAVARRAEGGETGNCKRSTYNVWRKK